MIVIWTRFQTVLSLHSQPRLITLTATGKVFHWQESGNTFLSGNSPSNELPMDDPFSVFWHDFATK